MHIAGDTHPFLHHNKVNKLSYIPSPEDIYNTDTYSLVVCRKGVIAYYADTYVPEQIIRRFYMHKVYHMHHYYAPPPGIYYKVYTWRKIAQLQAHINY